MTEIYKFIDVVKSLLVCACLCATLCATCRQEQTDERMSAQIEALKAVSVEMQECAIRDGQERCAE